MCEHFSKRINKYFALAFSGIAPIREWGGPEKDLDFCWKPSATAFIFPFFSRVALLDGNLVVMTLNSHEQLWYPRQ